MTLRAAKIRIQTGPPKAEFIDGDVVNVYEVTAFVDNQRFIQRMTEEYIDNGGIEQWIEETVVPKLKGAQ